MAGTLTPRLSGQKRVLFAATALAVSLSVSFALVEVAVRVARPTTDLMVLTGRELGPHAMGDWALVDAYAGYRARPGAFGEGKSVNSDGFISTPDIARAKAAGTIRIVALGGSSTAGVGFLLRDEETWPWRMGELLRARFPSVKFEVINGALGGYSSFDSIGRLWARLRFFDPDVVVFNHGWNEMYWFPEYPDLQSWRVRPDGSWGFHLTNKHVQRYEPWAVDPLIAWSQVLTKIRLRASRGAEGEVGRSGAPVSRDWPRDAIAAWRDNLSLLRAITDTLGIELLVAKQPTLVVAGLSEDQQKRCRYDYHGFDHNAHVEAFQALYTAIDETIPTERVVNATRLSGRPELFADHIHPTVAGAEEIARVMADAVADRLQAAGRIKGLP